MIFINQPGQVRQATFEKSFGIAKIFLHNFFACISGVHFRCVLFEEGVGLFEIFQCKVEANFFPPLSQAFEIKI